MATGTADGLALRRGIGLLLDDPASFSDTVLPDHALRGYQRGPARAIAASIREGRGEQHVLVFSRQAGKDEVLAQLLAWALVRHHRRGGNAVMACPSFNPQGTLARDRLVDRLRAMVPSGLVESVTTQDGHVVRVGLAAARFLSADARANARGQTADLLLIANEAQDIAPERWDTVFDPMAASTNATTVFAGTTWSRQGLLSRQMRHLATIEDADGRQRVWRVAWEAVAAELPAYGDRVRARIAQFGPDHPAIRTEYGLEEVADDGQLLPAERRAQLRGDHPRLRRRPAAGTAGADPAIRYALLIDVGGEDRAAGDVLDRPDTAGPPRDRDRDSTALTVVAIDPGDGDRPDYRVVDRRVWTGTGSAALHAQLADLARTTWRASVIVIDATGIGAGLAGFLGATFRSPAGRVRTVAGLRPPGTPGWPVVVPFTFGQRSKSDLGWALLALIDAGRLREYADDGAADTARFWAEAAAVAFEVVPGPGQLMRWGVPPRRGHDDLVMSLALVAELDRFRWRPRVATGHPDDDA